MRGSRARGRRASHACISRARERVQRAERLVEAQDGRAGEQRARERDALAHAAATARTGGRARSRRGRARRTAVRARSRASSLLGARHPQRQRGVVERVRARAAAGRAGASAPRAARGDACRRRALQAADELQQRRLPAAADGPTTAIRGHPAGTSTSTYCSQEIRTPGDWCENRDGRAGRLVLRICQRILSRRRRHDHGRHGAGQSDRKARAAPGTTAGAIDQRRSARTAAARSGCALLDRRGRGQSRAVQLGAGACRTATAAGARSTATTITSSSATCRLPITTR